MQSPYYINLPSAQRIVQPRVLVFARCIARAMREWNTGLSGYHAIFDEFWRGVTINQLWYTNVEHLLPASSGVVVHKVGNGKYLVIDDQVVLRCKHLDDSYRPRNYPTSRSKSWEQQQPFRSIPPLVRLDLGYRLDLTGTVVQDVMIMLSQNKQTLWRWQIWGHPISEFASTPKDMFGRQIYVHSDYSGVKP